ncbi:DgyrCDS10924 [Dimorphilus gyrociliatus]|uniref:DgyrCDS10924 n=1 Tax=Dimorphilus gyrociliatus TaxID=2664684 RepID=A0A7I8W356_9ANNE|nr:DgyrCDS10924 [Dimorphilus gyrociliatus]
MMLTMSMARLPGLTFACKFFIKVVRFMLKHPEVIAFISAVVFTYVNQYSYGSGNNQQSITREQLPPTPFFPPTSYVIDAHNGDMQNAIKLLKTGYYILVYYYAPWCARSVSARSEFEKTSRYLLTEQNSTLRFVAINCWWPDGACRQQNRFLSFPTLYLFKQGWNGIKYNGLLTSEEIISWVSIMMKPYTYLPTIERVESFTKLNEFSVIAFIDPLANNRTNLTQFHFASIRFHEADTITDVKFGVVTNIFTAKVLHLHQSGQIVFLRTFNSSIYYTGKDFTSSALKEWVTLCKSQSQTFVGKWQPSYTKSLGLSSLLKSKNLLLIFSPEHSLLPPNGNLSYIVRSAALQYYSCYNETPVRIDTILKEMEDDYRTKVKTYSELADFCSNNRKTFLRTKCCACTLVGSDICITGQSPCSFIDNAVNSIIPATYAHSISNRIKHVEHTRCQLQNFRKANRWTSSKTNLPSAINLEGNKFQFNNWGCSNKSLNIRILNSKKSWVLANRLGLKDDDFNIGKAVIIDKSRELVSIMKEEITFENLSKFIFDYHENNLKENKAEPESDIPQCNPSAPACVVSLNSKNFKSFISQDKDVIVYFTSPNCASCLTYNHIYIELARYFNHTKFLSFGKIDVRNVPIRLKPVRVPSLILFPAYDKDDSTVIEAKKSKEELVAWVVENIQARLVLSDGFNCNKECIEYNLNRTDYWIKFLYNQIEKIETREVRLNQKKNLKDIESFYVKYLELSRTYKKEQLINIYRINTLLSNSDIHKDTLSNILGESKLKEIFNSLKNLNINGETRGAG